MVNSDDKSDPSPADRSEAGPRSPDLLPMGDSALMVRWGGAITSEVHQRVTALARHLEAHSLSGITEAVPGYVTLTVFYDPLRLSYQEVHRYLEERLFAEGDTPQEPSRLIEIPVLYGGEDGPDLSAVAEHNGLSEEEVVRIHAGTEYRVFFIGFAPGFPYLGGMSPRIAVSRRANPRLSVPAGSVGIAGEQTGIYPLETPGGWQVIGRTPLALFRSDLDPPSLLRAGDRVRFRPISPDEVAEVVVGEG
jgi:inhibitor of KinA